MKQSLPASGMNPMIVASARFVSTSFFFDCKTN